MVVPHSSVHLRSVADELEDIGVLFAVDIESVPFFPGLRIYSVSKEIFPVIRQVDIGKLDTGRVVLPVQGCRDGEVVVIEFLLFCKADLYAAILCQELQHEFQHGLLGLVQPSVDKGVLGGEQMQLVGAHFVRGFARLRIVFLYFIHICHIVGFMFPAG